MNRECNYCGWTDGHHHPQCPVESYNFAVAESAWQRGY